MQVREEDIRRLDVEMAHSIPLRVDGAANAAHTPSLMDHAERFRQTSEDVPDVRFRDQKLDVTVAHDVFLDGAGVAVLQDQAHVGTILVPEGFEQKDDVIVEAFVGEVFEYVHFGNGAGADGVSYVQNGKLLADVKTAIFDAAHEVEAVILSAVEGVEGFDDFPETFGRREDWVAAGWSR